MPTLANSKPSKKDPRRVTGGVYDTVAPNEEIWCVYFYYVTDRNGPDEVKAYCYDSYRRIYPADLRGVIDERLSNVFDGGDLPPQCGDRFRAFKWRRKSYIAIALDSKTMKFDPGNALRVKDTTTASNHTFFEAGDYVTTVTVAGEKREISIVYFTNHMYSKISGDLGDHERDTFDFYWNLVPKKKGAKKDRKADIKLPPDSGGTNLGPPSPPPFRKKKKKKKAAA